MRRPKENSANAIVIRMGNKVNLTNGLWYPGYYFGYDNTGSVFILKFDTSGNHTLIYSGTTSLVNQFGWNTLKVKAIGWKFWYYLNGCLVHYFTDTDFPRGYIGIAAYRQGSTYQVFKVDRAKLVVEETPQ
jgi:hypothetical protein